MKLPDAASPRQHKIAKVSCYLVIVSVQGQSDAYSPAIAVSPLDSV